MLSMKRKKKMIEKIDKGISDEKAMLAILVAKTNELIEVANQNEKKAQPKQSSWG